MMMSTPSLVMRSPATCAARLVSDWVSLTMILMGCFLPSPHSRPSLTAASHCLTQYWSGMPNEASGPVSGVTKPTLISRPSPRLLPPARRCCCRCRRRRAAPREARRPRRVPRRSARPSSGSRGARPCSRSARSRSSRRSGRCPQNPSLASLPLACVRPSPWVRTRPFVPVCACRTGSRVPSPDSRDRVAYSCTAPPRDRLSGCSPCEQRYHDTGIYRPRHIACQEQRRRRREQEFVCGAWWSEAVGRRRRLRRQAAP